MTRTAADIFRAAHAATRAAVARWGCDYRATFAVALRAEYGQEDAMTGEERAERAANEFAKAVRKDGHTAVIEEDYEAGTYEVRVIRILSRRRQPIGSVTFHGDGHDVELTRRVAFYARLAQQCEAM